MKVIKRDGSEVTFDSAKLKSAISKANVRSNEMTVEDIDRIVSIVENKCARTTGDLNVEDIQDIIEQTLQASKFKATAKQYILYRDQRTRIRQSKSKLYQEVGKKLKGLHVVHQNANVDELSFGGRKGEASNELNKQYALDFCMSEKSRNHHLNNEIYIHDLDSYAVGMTNCLSLPVDEMMKHGFNTRQTDIREAGSINTFCQLLAVGFQLQSLQQFGGVSATHLDWSAVPYIRKSLFKHYLLEYLKNTNEFEELNLDTLTDEELDDWISDNKVKFLQKFNLTVEDFYIGSPVLEQTLYRRALFETRRETFQAVEGMYHNLNTLQSRSGNQLPFTSINFGTCTLPEGRLFIRALIEGSIKGVGKLHRTAIFPCQIFQYMKGVNDKPGTPNYDLYRLALECTSKRLYPNYANVDWSGNAGYDRNDPKTYFSTMGKRKL